MRFICFTIFFYISFATNFLQIVESVNKLNTTWKASPIDNPERFTSLLGYLRSNEKAKVVSFDAIDDEIPESFDPREQWPECTSLSEIRDQSNCGSCWAFAAVEAATDRLCIGSKGEHKERLSTQDLVSCCDTCGYGCNGGYPLLAWKYFHDTGISTGGEYGSKEWCNSYAFPKCDHHCEGKYEPCLGNALTPECVKTCQDGYSIPYASDKHYFKEAYTVNTVADIQKDLMTNGPQEVALDVYEDFYTYKSGVYQHVTGAYLGGHSVKLLGWGVEDGTPYWLVANSWNEDWGDNGYFKILRGKDECGIESENIAALPNL